MTHMRADPGHDLAHLDRVWQSAQQIARTETGASMRVLLAACYLHDLVNLPKSSPERSRASGLSADKAMPLLAELGFDDTEAAATHHAIAAHSFSAGIPPRTVEAAIVRDADRLDALGAMGLARWFGVSADMGSALYHPDDPYAQDRDLDDRRFALDHWRTKLVHLQDDMLTERGRVLARERTAVMQRYLRALADEIGKPAPRQWLHR